MSCDVWARLRENATGFDNEQINMFFEKMLDGFAYHKIIVDSTGKPVDYIFLEINTAFERLTGLKREKIIARKRLRLFQESRKTLQTG